MDEEFLVGELKLAFSYHIVKQILEADGKVVPAEAQFFKRMFPQALLERARFRTPAGGYTPRWHEACGEALLQLPTRPVKERLKIVETLFKAALADDEFELAEAEIMERAARLLGLSHGQYDGLMDRLVTSEVSLEPGGD